MTYKIDNMGISNVRCAHQREVINLDGLLVSLIALHYAGKTM